jgi:hypothetical protein
MIKIAVRTLGLNLTKMYIFRKVFKRMGNVWTVDSGSWLLKDYLVSSGVNTLLC